MEEHELLRRAEDLVAYRFCVIFDLPNHYIDSGHSCSPAYALMPAMPKIARMEISSARIA